MISKHIFFLGLIICCTSKTTFASFPLQQFANKNQVKEAHLGQTDEPSLLSKENTLIQIKNQPTEIQTTNKKSVKFLKHIFVGMSCFLLYLLYGLPSFNLPTSFSAGFLGALFLIGLIIIAIIVTLSSSKKEELEK